MRYPIKLNRNSLNDKRNLKIGPQNLCAYDSVSNMTVREIKGFSDSVGEEESYDEAQKAVS